LNKAQEEGRVLLTHDLDFGELLAASGAGLPSVIVFRLRDMCPDTVNQHVRGIISQHGGSLDQGAIISVTEGQIRVRPLPVETGD
jgi:predicted nuclease of predicted toxin-antitoxin system